MEKLNIKLFSLVLEAAGSKYSPRLYEKLRKLTSKCAASSYNRWEYESGNEGSGSSFNKRDYENDYDDNEFGGGRPRRYNNNRSQNFNSYDRGRSNNFQRRNQSAGDGLSKPHWENIELKPFEKDFYKPSDEVLNRSVEEIAEFRKAHNLSLLGKNIPNPILEFTDHKFPKEIMNTFSNNGFESPTPIQAQGWPIALSGRDFIGIGQTGSGKTLGYTVPGLVHIQHQARVEQNEGPIGLVLAPTRELVQQIHEVSQDMFSASQLKTVCVFGGANKVPQANTLHRSPSFCIATPGRLLDFLESGVTNLRRCTYLVLDEADRMLDMGFEPQIRKIVNQIRPNRQTLMWSATWPEEVADLASDFLTDFVRLNVGSLELYANPDIKQLVEVCIPKNKQQRFIEKMSELSKSHAKILVFSQTKIQVDDLARKLYRAGISARGIHGDHSQSKRNYTLEDFREGKFKVLVATDVASRGLDVNDITMVVNYDFPQTIEDYVHRIGRTARAGKTGTSFSLITEEDTDAAVKDLIKLMRKGNIEVPPQLETLWDTMSASKMPKRFNKGMSRYRKRW